MGDRQSKAAISFRQKNSFLDTVAEIDPVGELADGGHQDVGGGGGVRSAFSPPTLMAQQGRTFLERPPPEIRKSRSAPTPSGARPRWRNSSPISKSETGRPSTGADRARLHVLGQELKRADAILAERGQQAVASIPLAPTRSATRRRIVRHREQVVEDPP